MADGTGRGRGADARGRAGEPGSRRSVVDYSLKRRARLADVYAGRVALDDVCDAHPYLLRAARFHGQETGSTCPVCRKEDLAEVHYVYGDALKTTAGQAKSPRELLEMAGRLPEFSVYVVEVCPSCGWNHLAMSYVMGRSTPAPGRRQAARK